MTRKKWNRLRRQRPELFGMLPPFEKWNADERRLMATVSKQRAITVMSAYALEHAPLGDLYSLHLNNYGFDNF